MGNLCTDLAAVKDLVQARETLSDAGAATYREIFFLDGHFFRLTLALYADREAQQLALVNQLSISAAPVIVEKITLASGEAILVTAIDGCRSKPPELFSTARPLAPEALAQLRWDFDRLTAAKLVHPYAIRDYAHWHLVPESGRVVFDGWDVLRHMVPDEEQEVREKCEALLRGCSRRS